MKQDPKETRFQKILGFILPQSPWRIPVVVIYGVIVGLILVIFQLSNASSYVSDKPETCINCHIMTPQYATWQHSSHHGRATCNDCHVPHENYIRAYVFKATDGMRHAAMFTLGLEPQVFKLNEAGKTVVQNNCLRCHYNTVSQVSISNVNGHNYKKGQGLLCWQCHRDVPHGRVASQASTPYAYTPALSASIPEWVRNLTNKK